VGIIIGLRVGGAADHVGRTHPPFAQGIIAVDRQLDRAALLDSVATFYRHVMNAGDEGSSAAAFYRDYVRVILESPSYVASVIERYVGELSDLRMPAMGHHRP
jgi:hypothetical protein